MMVRIIRIIPIDANVMSKFSRSVIKTRRNARSKLDILPTRNNLKTLKSRKMRKNDELNPKNVRKVGKIEKISIKVKGVKVNFILPFHPTYSGLCPIDIYLSINSRVKKLTVNISIKSNYLL
jgi:hypothetical protein